MRILYLYDSSAETYAKDVLAEAGRDDVERYALPDGALRGTLSLDAATHLLVSGTFATLRRVLMFAAQTDHTVGIIPLPDQSRLTRTLALPKKPRALLDLVTKVAEKSVDLFYCNDVLVLGDIRIGENKLLESYEYDSGDGFLNRWVMRLSRWRTPQSLRHHRFTVTTDKEESITLSALGLIGLNHNNSSWIGHALSQELSATDGQVTLVALVPTSLFEFFVLYPIRLAWRRWWQGSALPETWGYLKSSQIDVAASEPLDVVVDDEQMLQTPVTLRVDPGAVRLSTGETFAQSQLSPKSSRNAIRLAGVPRDEERIEYFRQGLPLFAHASQEQYSTLFATLREESRLNWTFVILLILSTVLATLGLFINSASVIIGAMLLAPLMQPIVGLSMGVLRRDTGLLRSGAQAIVVGVGLVLASAMLIAFLTPIHELGSEMAARLSPTILDLLVAIASGTAAAYAKNNPKISGSLVGVAIAVALVPPLAVSGIGLGWGNFGMFSNAMLLFLTNLSGIVLAAALTFFVLGFSPIRIAKRGIAIWAAAVVLIAIPLYQSFDRMKTDTQIRQALEHVHFTYGGQTLSLGRVEYVQHGDRPQVRCEVTADRALSRDDRIYLREMITKVVGKPVDVLVTVRYRL